MVMKVMDRIWDVSTFVSVASKLKDDSQNIMKDFFYFQPRKINYFTLILPFLNTRWNNKFHL